MLIVWQYIEKASKESEFSYWKKKKKKRSKREPEGITYSEAGL